MAAPTPRCSLVIRCFNEEEHIGRLLTGVMEQTVEDVDIVVVDSGSTDATVAIASRFPTRVVPIRPEDFSFGRSLNLGFENCRAELVVAASAHVYPVRRDWLERLLAPLDDPDVALSYGKQRGAETSQYSEHRLFAQWFPEVSAADQKHPFCNNANAAVRRSVWQDLRYDEDLTGLEDVDFAKRAMAKGLKLAYVAEAPVVHVHDETPRRIFNRYRREALALRSISPAERVGLRDLARLLPAHIVSDSYHALRDGLLLEKAPQIAMFRAMQFLGAWWGWSTRGAANDTLRRRFYYPTGLDRPHGDDGDDGLQIDYGAGATGAATAGATGAGGPSR